jgi:hypothetical protein
MQSSSNRLIIESNESFSSHPPTSDSTRSLSSRNNRRYLNDQLVLQCEFWFRSSRRAPRRKSSLDIRPTKAPFSSTLHQANTSSRLSGIRSVYSLTLLFCSCHVSRRAAQILLLRSLLFAVSGRRDCCRSRRNFWCFLDLDFGGFGVRWS